MRKTLWISGLTPPGGMERNSKRTCTIFTHLTSADCVTQKKLASRMWSLDRKLFIFKLICVFGASVSCWSSCDVTDCTTETRADNTSLLVCTR